MYNQLRGLQKKAKDLRAEVRNLRRMSQAQAHSVRETIRDAFIKIRAMLLAGGEQVWQAGKKEFNKTKLNLASVRRFGYNYGSHVSFSYTTVFSYHFIDDGCHSCS